MKRTRLGERWMLKSLTLLFESLDDLLDRHLLVLRADPGDLAEDHLVHDDSELPDVRLEGYLLVEQSLVFRNEEK